MRKFELLAASAIVLLAATPAMAKSAPDAKPAADQAAAAQQPAQAEDQADSAGSDIIVTATKRETTLLDTPIAVSVTSADTIKDAQIRDLQDLQSVVPSLRVSQLQSSANTNFIIRGFGNGANNAGIEPSVGVFIDGVYRSRSAAQIADLPNLKRVEVLRGPQSTLFGKNASAGIISIVTAEPSFNGYKKNLEFTYGNYNELIVKGGISGPISDTLAWSFDGNFNRRDGYINDAVLLQDQNNRRRWGVRGQLVYQPSANFKLRLIADYDNIDERCCAVVNVDNAPGSTTALVNSLAAGGRGIIINQPFTNTTYTNFPSTNKLNNYGFSGQADYTFGHFALTSITAYREVGLTTNQDSDFSGVDLIGNNNAYQSINTFTQELRLASNFDGPINFLAGVYYFNEHINQTGGINLGTQFRPYGDALIRAATGNALNVATLEGTFGALEGQPTRYLNRFFAAGQGTTDRFRLADESYSLFGSADWNITDKLTFTAGVNYTDDRKNYLVNSTSTDVFSAVDFNNPLYAPFRNQLLFGGALASGVGSALGLGRSATNAEIGAFAVANNAAYNAIVAGSQAFANANQNNPAANPLAGLRALQFLPPFQNIPNSVEPGRTGDSDVSYSFRLAYKVLKGISVYVTYGTGFKASSVNLSRDSRPTAADLVAIRAAGFAVTNINSGSRTALPEKARVIEGGIKGQFSNFAFNTAIFSQSISNFQGNIFTGTGFILQNAGKESTFGVEFDSNWTPVKALNLNFALTYLDPVYDSFAQGSTFNASYGVVAANLTGQRPSGIPEFSISGGGSYTHRVSDAVKLTLRGDYQWESAVQISEGAPFQREVNALNMSLTAAIHDNVEVSIWGRNITNAVYLTTIFPSVAQSGSLSGYHSQPRTFGGTLRVKF